MKIEEVKEILGAETIVEVDNAQREIKMACGADLMSDVLSFIKEDALLLTGLTNPQVIRTAEMAGINTICFVRGKKPPDETRNLAREKGIQLFSTRLPMHESCGKKLQKVLEQSGFFSTRLPMHESCGRLYVKGLPGCSEVD